jgi:hypothetical protein
MHTGEIEVRGQDVVGLAVNIGARVAALADGGEVLVSFTVKDLVAGSGIRFEDRGEHELKGVPEAWRRSPSRRTEPISFEPPADRGSVGPPDHSSGATRGPVQSFFRRRLTFSFTLQGEARARIPSAEF